MPISTFMGLQTALRGLLAEQQGLNVAGHNVANASTVGYSRQEAVLTATDPLVVPAMSVVTGAGAQLGTGVDVTQIRRIRDQFLDIQYRAQNSQLGDATARANSLGQAQLAFGEPSTTGVSAQLSNFWSSWAALAKAPEDMATRQNVIGAAQNLVQALQAVSDQLTTTATQAGQEYAAITGPSGDVEVAARQLASLNDAIAHAVAVGQMPNDLLDRRDQLIDQLSELADVSVTDLTSGAVKVDFGGVTLIDPAATGGYTWPQTLTSPGGKLGALQSLASPTGPALTYRSQLDAITAQLVTDVNSIHTATPFFDPTGTTAATLTLQATASTIEAGSTATSGANDVATAISQLRGTTVDKAYAALVAQVGADVKSILQTQTNQETLVNAVDDRRQSISGVSLDEEMTNLIRFQRGYQASARTMTTIDDMLDTLINRTGKVGL